MVLASATMAPDLTPSITPSGPRLTCSDIAVSPTHRKTHSAFCATSFGVAQNLPFSAAASSFAFAAVFDQSATSCPARKRLRAIGYPMIPRPRNPSFAIPISWFWYEPQLYDAASMCDNCRPMKPPVLVTKRIYPEAIKYLQEHAEVDYASSDDGLSAEELLRRIRGKQGVVSQLTDKFTAAVIDQLQGVRVIANVAVGFDNIDVGAATRRKILVTNTPDVLTDTTADFAFALLMAAARRVVEGHRYVHSGKWRKWY